MPTLTIERQGCRSCSLCRDICPTKVFDLDDSQVAVAARPEDCIGCTSCEYLCPSRCLEVSDVQRQAPLYRIEENVCLVSRFLRAEPILQALPAEQWEGARRDVMTRLLGISDSIVETMGRGIKVVGRKAGSLAAEHLPEMYDDATLDNVLTSMQRRFASAFPFSYEITPDQTEVTIKMGRCALSAARADPTTQKSGVVLCGLFHEYWAGLLGTFTQKAFVLEATQDTCPCTLTLKARE